MSTRVGDCRLEQTIADALDERGIDYVTDFEGKNPAHLDFYLPLYDVHIEVKGGHSELSNSQLKRADNVILVQGTKAVELLADWLEQKP